MCRVYVRDLRLINVDLVEDWRTGSLGDKVLVTRAKARVTKKMGSIIVRTVTSPRDQIRSEWRAVSNALYFSTIEVITEAFTGLW
jgi:hypothetical protein